MVRAGKGGVGWVHTRALLRDNELVVLKLNYIHLLTMLRPMPPCRNGGFLPICG